MKIKTLVIIAMVCGMVIAAGTAFAAEGEFDANIMQATIGDLGNVGSQWTTSASPGKPREPVSGVAVKYHGNNKERNRLEYKVTFKNGYPISGVWYHDEPTLVIDREENYANGVRTVKSYHRNGGKLKSEERYLVSGEGNQATARVKDGLFKEYHQDGVLAGEVTYVKNVKEGVEKVYNKKGTLVDEIPYKAGQIHGLRKEYHDNGQLRKEEPYVDGYVEGMRKDYSDKGVLRMTKEFKKGHPDGEEVRYDNKGQVTEKKMFKEGRPVN